MIHNLSRDSISAHDGASWSWNHCISIFLTHFADPIHSQSQIHSYARHCTAATHTCLICREHWDPFHNAPFQRNNQKEQRKSTLPWMDHVTLCVPNIQPPVASETKITTNKNLPASSHATVAYLAPLSRIYRPWPYVSPSHIPRYKTTITVKLLSEQSCLESKIGAFTGMTQWAFGRTPGE